MNRIDGMSIDNWIMTSIYNTMDVSISTTCLDAAGETDRHTRVNGLNIHHIRICRVIYNIPA
jgi:hypothetical protein